MEFILTVFLIILVGGLYSLDSGKRSEISHYVKTVKDSKFNRNKCES